MKDNLVTGNKYMYIFKYTRRNKQHKAVHFNHFESGPCFLSWSKMLTLIWRKFSWAFSWGRISSQQAGPEWHSTNRCSDSRKCASCRVRRSRRWHFPPATGATRQGATRESPDQNWLGMRASCSANFSAIVGIEGHFQHASPPHTPRECVAAFSRVPADRGGC